MPPDQFARPKADHYAKDSADMTSDIDELR